MEREPLILSHRLELVATSLRIVQADLHDREELSRLLDAQIPKSWPPSLVDRAILEWTKSKLDNDIASSCWFSRYLVLKDPRLLIGLGGFKGPPDGRGVVEIGYSILPEHQQKGYATEALKALCEWAFSNPQVSRIIAETYPDLTASISVLENCRFVYAGNGSEIGVARYQLWRPQGPIIAG